MLASCAVGAHDMFPEVNSTRCGVETAIVWICFRLIHFPYLHFFFIFWIVHLKAFRHLLLIFFFKFIQAFKEFPCQHLFFSFVKVVFNICQFVWLQLLIEYCQSLLEFRCPKLLKKNAFVFHDLSQLFLSSIWKLLKIFEYLCFGNGRHFQIFSLQQLDIDLFFLCKFQLELVKFFQRKQMLLSLSPWSLYFL